MWLQMNEHTALYIFRMKVLIIVYCDIVYCSQINSHFIQWSSPDLWEKLKKSKLDNDSSGDAESEHSEEDDVPFPVAMLDLFQCDPK